jgi:hypothetical protein
MGDQFQGNKKATKTKTKQGSATPGESADTEPAILTLWRDMLIYSDIASYRQMRPKTEATTSARRRRYNLDWECAKGK